MHEVFNGDKDGVTAFRRCRNVKMSHILK